MQGSAAPCHLHSVPPHFPAPRFPPMAGRAADTTQLPPPLCRPCLARALVIGAPGVASAAAPAHSPRGDVWRRCATTCCRSEPRCPRCVVVGGKSCSEPVLMVWLCGVGVLTQHNGSASFRLSSPQCPSASCTACDMTHRGAQPEHTVRPRPGRTTHPTHQLNPLTPSHALPPPLPPCSSLHAQAVTRRIVVLSNNTQYPLTFDWDPCLFPAQPPHISGAASAIQAGLAISPR